MSEPGCQSPRLLDQMRAVLGVWRYALRTERAYCDWVRRDVKFHRMRCRADLEPGTAKVEAFLPHLAVAGRVAPATQNQALNALGFLYGREAGGLRRRMAAATGVVCACGFPHRCGS